MKRSLRDRPMRLVAVAALASLVTGACVKPDPPSVGIKALAADIVFGAAPIEEAETEPVAFQPPAENPTAEVAVADELPPQVFTPPPPKSFPRPPFQAPSKPPVVCPAAAVDEFPDVIAPQNVPAGALPKEGIYLWKKSGSRTISGGVTVPVEGFEERAIRNVTLQAADPANANRIRFTYETVQPNPADDGLVVTRYFVDTAATSSEVNNTVGSQRFTVGAPERGIVIDSVTYTDENGTQVDGGRPFNPISGLLLTPLPIRTGETFQSVATDPTTQQTWVYDAQLVERDRVDACGEILDGWRTDGTLRVSGSQGGERSFSVIASPQFGGIVISERSAGTDADGTAYDITYSIGQLEPSPFPTAG